MTVLRAYASSVVSTAGTWSNTSNALGAPNGTIANTGTTAQVKTIRLGGFDLSSIPTDATIYRVTVGAHASTNTTPASAELHIYAGSGGSNLQTFGLSLTTSIAEYSGNSSGSWTRSSVQTIEAEFHSPSTTRRFNVDSMYIEVEYLVTTAVETTTSTEWSNKAIITQTSATEWRVYGPEVAHAWASTVVTENPPNTWTNETNAFGGTNGTYSQSEDTALSKYLIFDGFDFSAVPAGAVISELHYGAVSQRTGNSNPDYDNKTQLALMSSAGADFHRVTFSPSYTALTSNEYQVSRSWTRSELDGIRVGYYQLDNSVVGLSSQRRVDSLWVRIVYTSSTSVDATPVSTTWGTQIAVSKTSATEYVVRSAVPTATCSTSFNVAEAISKSLTTEFDTAAALEVARETSFGVQVNAETDLETSYDTNVSAEASEETSFNVAEAVLSAVATTFDTAAAVEVEAETSFDTATFAVTARETSFDVLVSAEAEVDTTWETVGQARADVDTNWSTSAVAEKELETEFNTAAAVSASVETSYSVRTSVSTASATSWTAFHPVAPSTASATSWRVYPTARPDQVEVLQTLVARTTSQVASLTTASFFVPAGSMIAVSQMSSHDSGDFYGTSTTTMVDSSGLTWTRRVMEAAPATGDSSIGRGAQSIWTAPVPSDRTITVTGGVVGGNKRMQLHVFVLFNATFESGSATTLTNQVPNNITATVTAPSRGTVAIFGAVTNRDGGVNTIVSGPNLVDPQKLDFTGSIHAISGYVQFPLELEDKTVSLTGPAASLGAAWKYAYARIRPTTTDYALTITSQTRWDTAQAITATSASTWKTHAAVSATKAGTWKTFSVVPDTERDTSWTVRATASLTEATTWKTFSAVPARTRLDEWTVYSPAVPAKSLETAWETRALAALDAATDWDTYVVAQDAHTAIWDTFYATAPRSELTEWTVRVAAQASSAITWDTYLVVTDDLLTRWRTLPEYIPGSPIDQVVRLGGTDSVVNLGGRIVIVRLSASNALVTLEESS